MATLPSNFIIERARLTNNSNDLFSESRSLRIVQRKTAGQRWDFVIDSIDYRLKDIKPLWAFFAQVKQTLDTVAFTLPVYSESDVDQKITLSSASAGATTVAIGNSNDVVAGDYFTFAGHSKAYLVTGIVGNQLTFAPNLIRPVAGGELLTFDGCQFTCRVTEVIEFDAQGQNASLQIELAEAL